MSSWRPADAKAWLLDLDGVLHVGGEPIPGAAEAVAHLRSRHLPFRITTNTTTRSREQLAADLSTMGIAVSAAEIINAPFAAILHLRHIGSPRCRLLMRDDVQSDFAEFPTSDIAPDVIVVGDIGERWDYALMRELFLQIRSGARIVALHKGKYWQEKDGLRLDIGAFIAGLEYATGTIADVVGKPSRPFFELALSDLGVRSSDAVMVGDDIELDIGGAQAAGLRGVLVKTGKYRTETHTASGIEPDAVWESIADLRSV